MSNTLFIEEILNKGSGKLKASEISDPTYEGVILLAFSLNKTKEWILSSYNHTIEEKAADNFFKLIERRSNHEPIAYIVGYKEFYGLNFKVNKHVLIPRPDSEVLVQEVINDFSNLSPTILDLGTGSGCLIISIFNHIKSANGIGVDICDHTLEIAAYNAKKHDLLDRLKLIKSNWFDNIKNELFDVIIANPPYISKSDIKFIAKETMQHEPKKALFADENGLYNYKIIANNAFSMLNDRGKIYLEIGFNQQEQVIDIFQQQNFRLNRSIKDINKHDRVLIFNKY